MKELPNTIKNDPALLALLNLPFRIKTYNGLIGIDAPDIEETLVQAFERWKLEINSYELPEPEEDYRDVFVRFCLEHLKAAPHNYLNKHFNKDFLKKLDDPNSFFANRFPFAKREINLRTRYLKNQLGGYNKLVGSPSVSQLAIYYKLLNKYNLHDGITSQNKDQIGKKHNRSSQSLYQTYLECNKALMTRHGRNTIKNLKAVKSMFREHKKIKNYIDDLLDIAYSNNPKEAEKDEFL